MVVLISLFVFEVVEALELRVASSQSVCSFAQIIFQMMVTSLYDLYTTGNDLVDYYSGEKTSKENVMEHTSIVRDLFISIVEWLLK